MAKTLHFMGYLHFPKGGRPEFSHTPLTPVDHDDDILEIPIFRKVDPHMPIEMIPMQQPPQRGKTIDGIFYPIGVNETDESFSIRLSAINAALHPAAPPTKAPPTDTK